MKRLIIVNEAEAYSQRIVAEAKGEEARFNQVSAAYEANPEITLKRYRLEAMRDVLLNTRSKVIMDKNAGEKVLPYLAVNETKLAPSVAADKREIAKK